MGLQLLTPFVTSFFCGFLGIYRAGQLRSVQNPGWLFDIGENSLPLYIYIFFFFMGTIIGQYMDPY